MQNKFKTSILHLKQWLIKYKLIPYYEGTIESNLSKEEIKVKLLLELDIVEKFTYSVRRDTFKDYEGFIKGDKFEFRRILKSGRNSFIPTVQGILKQSTDKTKILINVQLNKFVSVLLLLFCLFQITMFTLDYASSSSPLLSEENFDKEYYEQILDKETYKALFEVEEYNIDWNHLYLIITPLIIVTVWFNFELSLVKSRLSNMMNTKEILNNKK